MEPYEPTDERYFTHYCEKSYDNHTYKIIFKNKKSITVDSYEVMKSMWYQWKNDVETVEVLDKSGKGF